MGVEATRDTRAAHAFSFRNSKNGVKDFRTKDGSSQGQNLASTGLCVPPSLASGAAQAETLGRKRGDSLKHFIVFF